MSIEHELREAAKPINGWAKPGQADLMLRAADELSRLRTRVAELEAAGYGKPVIRRVPRPPLTIYGDPETSLGWANPAPDASPAIAPNDSATIRICPMRDGPCRHGLHCPYVGDGYMGYPCREGWNGPRALSEREGQE